MHNIWTEINQKKLQQKSLKIQVLQFFKTKVKKNLFLHIFCWILLFMKIARIDPQGIRCISSSKCWNFSWRKRLSKRLFMLCFPVICSWRQKCQSLLVSAGLWCHAGLKPNVLSVLTTPLMIYQYSSKLKDSQIIMSEMLYQFEKMRLSGKNNKKKNPMKTKTALMRRLCLASGKLIYQLDQSLKFWLSQLTLKTIILLGLANLPTVTFWSHSKFWKYAC